MIQHNRNKRRLTAEEYNFLGLGGMGGGGIGIILLVSLLLANQKFSYWALILVPSAIMFLAGATCWIIGKIKKRRSKTRSL